MKLRFQLRDLFFAVTLLSVALAYVAWERAWTARRVHSASICLSIGGVVRCADSPWGPSYRDPRQPAEEIYIPGTFRFGHDKVDWTMPQIPDSDVVAAAITFPEAPSLKTSARKMDGAWVEALSHLRELQQVDICEGEVDPRTQIAIARLSKLRKLKVCFVPLTTEFIKELGNSKSVEEVTISVDHGRIEELIQLAKIPTLKKLYLVGMTSGASLDPQQLQAMSIVERFMKERPDVALFDGPEKELGYLVVSPAPWPPTSFWQRLYMTYCGYFWLPAGMLAATLGYIALRSRWFRRNVSATST